MKTKQLRVWNIINPPNAPDHYAVETPEEAVDLINRLANIQLKCDHIHSNAFGLEVFEDGEWNEWYSEDGEDIDDYAERLTPISPPHHTEPL